MTEQSDSSTLTRRVAMAAGWAGVAATAALTGGQGAAQSGSEPERTPPPVASARQPVVFLPHGGGPWPFVETGVGTQAEQAELAEYLRSIAALPKTPPKALLVISAHWEEAVR